jgi:hypothetical protein
VRFEALTAVSMKVAVFWVIAQCSLVEGTDVSEVLTVSIIRIIDLIMETASTSEISVNFYQTARRNNPKTTIFIFHKYYILLQLLNIPDVISHPDCQYGTSGLILS